MGVYARRKGSPAPGSQPSPNLRLYAVLFGLFAIAAFFVRQESRELSNPSRHIALAPHATSNAGNALPLALPGEPSASSERDLLARARLENELVYTDLQSFVCSEHIDRYKGRIDDNHGRQIDTVTAQVSFENGVENYTDIHENNHSRPALSSLRGAWSEGEFGTLLRQTHDLLATQPVTLKADTQFEGTPAVIYSLDVSEQDSPWDLVVGDKHYRIPFQTDVWVSKSNGKILKLERTSTSIPYSTGITSLRWSVTLDSTIIDGKAWLLPKTGEYEVAYAGSGRHEWNIMDFSDYRRYGSRTIMHF